MTNAERAEKMRGAIYCHLYSEGYDKKDVDKILIGGLDEAQKEAVLTATEAVAIDQESYERGKRDSIIEFCEGDRSLLAEYEQKAYTKGFATAREKAAGIAEAYLSIGSIMNPQFEQIAKNTSDQIRKMEP